MLLVVTALPSLAQADELAIDPVTHSAPSASVDTVTATAQAEQTHAPAEAAHDHVASLGFRIVAGTSRAYRDNTWVFGFGATGELHLGLGFELGLGAAVLLGEVSEVFPIELFLRKSFELARDVDFYLQAGPITAIVTEPGHETLVLFGGTFAGGFTLWMNEGFGILVEATYQFVSEENIVHDIEGAVGVAVRL